METIEKILMERDGLTLEEAETAVRECRDDLMSRLANGELPFDICGEYFNLEEDYLVQLIYKGRVPRVVDLQINSLRSR